MKKITVVALVGILVLSLAGSVALAAPGDAYGPGGCCPAFGANGQQVNLTSEQKAQFDIWHKDRMEHRKEVLQKQVEWGWLNQEQADQEISYMEQYQKDGYGRMGMGPDRMHGGHSRGGCGYGGWAR